MPEDASIQDRDCTADERYDSKTDWGRPYVEYGGAGHEPKQCSWEEVAQMPPLLVPRDSDSAWVVHGGITYHRSVAGAGRWTVWPEQSRRRGRSLQRVVIPQPQCLRPESRGQNADDDQPATRAVTPLTDQANTTSSMTMSRNDSLHRRRRR
ncbi:MAG: hypothetical protein JWM57_3375 [Phycisphaerales bacterium]|nr:hypothetical protein [Phycisphaerales bacterium]